MRKVTIFLIALLAIFLVACSPIDSTEAATSTMNLQVVSITTGIDTEVYVQARSGNNPVNFVEGDHFYIRQDGGPKVALTKTESLEWLNNGNAFYGSFSDASNIEIIFERANGEIISGTTFTVFTDTLQVTKPDPSDHAELYNSYADSVEIKWIADGNQDDAVALNAKLNADAPYCTISGLSEEDEEEFRTSLEFAAAFIDLFGPGDHISSMSEDATVADEKAYFAYELPGVDNVTEFYCDAELYINRISADFTTSNLVVAPAFKGVSSSSQAINRTVIDLWWDQFEAIL